MVGWLRRAIRGTGYRPHVASTLRGAQERRHRREAELKLYSTVREEAADGRAGTSVRQSGRAASIERTGHLPIAMDGDTFALEGGVVSRPVRWLCSPCFGVGVLSCVLYLATMAPSVTWGDDADFQTRAFQLETDVGARGYPVWTAVAHLASRVPIGNVAARVNAFNALLGGLAVALMFAAVKAWTGSTFSAWVAATAMAVSHTFWFVATKTEVYTAHAAILGAILYYIAKYETAGKPWHLWGAALLLALGLLHHMFIVLLYPAAIVYYVWALVRCRDGTRRQVAVTPVFFALGLVPLVVVGAHFGMFHAGPVAAMNKLLFAGDPVIRGSVLRFDALGLVRNVGYCLAFTLYNFPSPALVLALVGVVTDMRHHQRRFVLLLLMWGTAITFVLNYGTGERWMSLLPAHLIVAVWAGVGASRSVGWLASVIDRRPLSVMTRDTRAAGLVLACCFVMPTVLYWAFPQLLNRFDKQLFATRDTRFHDYDTSFLWPCKAGYRGAEMWRSEVMARVPPDSRVFASWGAFAVLRYAQTIERARPDLSLHLKDRVSLTDTKRWSDDLNVPTFYVTEPFRVVSQVVPADCRTAFHVVDSELNLYSYMGMWEVSGTVSDATGRTEKRGSHR